MKIQKTEENMDITEEQLEIVDERLREYSPRRYWDEDLGDNSPYWGELDYFVGRGGAGFMMLKAKKGERGWDIYLPASNRNKVEDTIVATERYLETGKLAEERLEEVIEYLDALEEPECRECGESPLGFVETIQRTARDLAGYGEGT